MNDSNKRASDGWSVIGHVPVDAGCLMLMDPCYLRDRLFAGSEQIESWYDDAVVDHAEETHWAVKHHDERYGHIVSTGYGDGFYPIEARFNSEGLIAEVRIRFINED